VPVLFSTKISRLRLTLSPFTSEQQARIGESMIDAKLARWRQAIDSNDDPAKPLSQTYAKRKSQRLGRSPIRDWYWSGRTQGAFKVKNANEEIVTIGFVDPVADQKITINRRICEMLSDSPSDTEALHAAVSSELRKLFVNVTREGSVELVA
jgi:hypothetical protein